MGMKDIEQSNFPLISSVCLDVRSGTGWKKLFTTLGETVRPSNSTTDVGTTAMAFCGRKEGRVSIPNARRESGDLQPGSRAGVERARSDGMSPLRLGYKRQ